uniref:Uncharacterized protein n=1 Tax=Leclercia adecarboxylata TaxID=83655 RepID=A0A5B8KQX3_9ENTR|nr:Hypothetical protein [Leclercia adecarboxylata]
MTAPFNRRDILSNCWRLHAPAAHHKPTIFILLNHEIIDPQDDLMRYAHLRDLVKASPPSVNRFSGLP